MLLQRLFPLQVAHFHLKIIAYYGGNKSLEQTKAYIIRILSYMLLAFSFFGFIGLVFDIALLYCGCLITVLIPVVYYRDLDQKVKYKKRLLLLELPEFLNKLTFE